MDAGERDEFGDSLSTFVTEVSSELAENISVLIESGRRGMVVNIVTDLYPADLARLLEHLPFDDAHKLFHWLTDEQGGDVLPELDDDFRAALLEEAPPDRIAAFLDEMDTDDAADVLADLPQEVVEEVLPGLEDATEVQELLSYDEETAGGIMGAEYVAVPMQWSVAQATEEVRRQAETVEPIFAVFVVDADSRLLGAVSLKRLLLSRSNALVSEVVDINDICVDTEMDQEEVARIMERYDLVSLPVVDAEKRIVGRITIDDIVDVIRDEAEEDVQRMSGVAGGEEHTDSVLQISRGRLPWLLAGLGGAGLSALVITSFEYALSAQVYLAAFIPIVMATAGNAGIQSSAIAVQGLASGDIWTGDIMKRLSKELGVSVINGITLALVLGLAVLAFMDVDNGLLLAVTASLALVSVIILATSIGAAVPLVLHRFGVDPAISTGPFITTLNDILGILIFFVLATVLYL